jgi:hypothetical protein
MAPNTAMCSWPASERSHIDHGPPPEDRAGHEPLPAVNDGVLSAAGPSTTPHPLRAQTPRCLARRQAARRERLDRRSSVAHHVPLLAVVCLLSTVRLSFLNRLRELASGLLEVDLRRLTRDGRPLIRLVTSATRWRILGGERFYGIAPGTASRSAAGPLARQLTFAVLLVQLSGGGDRALRRPLYRGKALLGGIGPSRSELGAVRFLLPGSRLAPLPVRVGGKP